MTLSGLRGVEIAQVYKPVLGQAGEDWVRWRKKWMTMGFGESEEWKLWKMLISVIMMMIPTSL